MDPSQRSPLHAIAVFGMDISPLDDIRYMSLTQKEGGKNIVQISEKYS